jgi:UDP-N-acetylmuramate dehydrogenase
VSGTAARFAKNPLVPPAQAAAHKRQHPAMVQRATADGTVKLSAAWLIEACGFKGLREGDVGMSNRHALVLVNHGHASGAELWALAQRVREGVQAHFGVRLEPEPLVV